MSQHILFLTSSLYVEPILAKNLPYQVSCMFGRLLYYFLFFEKIIIMATLSRLFIYFLLLLLDLKLLDIFILMYKFRSDLFISLHNVMTFSNSTFVNVVLDPPVLRLDLKKVVEDIYRHGVERLINLCKEMFVLFIMLWIHISLFKVNQDNLNFIKLF